MRGQPHDRAPLPALRAPMASQSEQRRLPRICSRRSCKGHALGGVGDIDQMINLMNRMFETPYD